MSDLLDFKLTSEILTRTDNFLSKLLILYISAKRKQKFLHFCFFFQTQNARNSVFGPAPDLAMGAYELPRPLSQLRRGYPSGRGYPSPFPSPAFGFWNSPPGRFLF